MAVRTREELMEIINKYIGDRTDEESLSLLEDVSDSFNQTDTANWEEKYNELAGRYRARFLEASASGTLEPNNSSENETKVVDDTNEESDETEPDFEDVFKED